MELAARHLRTAPASSPALDLAALLGEEAWARLPAAVQRRFGMHHLATAVTYHGTLDLHCSALGRAIAWATSLLGGPLTAWRHQGLQAAVHVYPDGRGGMVWERRLRLPGRAGDRVVRSTKEPGGAAGLVERTDGGLAMELEVLEDDGALVFRSLRYLLVIGGLRVPVPAFLSPGTCTVEHRDLGGGRFRFTLSMVHPRWGRTFHQTGVFADPQEDFA